MFVGGAKLEVGVEVFDYFTKMRNEDNHRWKGCPYLILKKKKDVAGQAGRELSKGRQL